jgi:hypothetical protein
MVALGQPDEHGRDFRPCDRATVELRSGAPGLVPRGAGPGADLVQPQLRRWHQCREARPRVPRSTEAFRESGDYGPTGFATVIVGF